MSMLMEPFALWQRDLGRYLTKGATGFFPPADVLVTDEDVTVHLDVPGLRKDDIEIELEHDVLTIRGERPFPYESEGDGGRGTWRRIERPFGSFERVLRVSHGLEEDAIEASLHDGVLTLRMRKPQPREPHRIEVKAEETVEDAPTPKRARTRKQLSAFEIKSAVAHLHGMLEALR